MVKHTQTILRRKPTNCLSVFDHFVGLALNIFAVRLETIKKGACNLCREINSNFEIFSRKVHIWLWSNPHKIDCYTLLRSLTPLFNEVHIA